MDNAKWNKFVKAAGTVVVAILMIIWIIGQLQNRTAEDTGAESTASEVLQELAESAESLEASVVESVSSSYEELAQESVETPSSEASYYYDDDEEDSKPNGEDYNDPNGPSGQLDPYGTYTSRDDVALYLYTYNELPDNFITKKEAEDLGWTGGGLENYAPGKCIGGDKFSNYQKLLPTAKGRQYYECDIDTLGQKKRGAKRIVYSNDGLIYYTDDHYESFTLLYGNE